MIEREEIDMLRRLVADLTERVRALEARPAVPSVPGPIFSRPWESSTSPWTPFPPVTSGDPMPAQTVTTGVGPAGVGTAMPSHHWLADSRGEV